MDWARLADTVVAHRKRRAWSQRDLANRSGVSVRTIRRLESGRQHVGERSLLTVEAALGWRNGSVERVLKGGRPIPEVDEDLAAVMAVWPRLRPEVRRVLRTMAEESAR